MTKIEQAKAEKKVRRTVRESSFKLTLLVTKPRSNPMRKGPHFVQGLPYLKQPRNLSNHFQLTSAKVRHTSCPIALQSTVE